MSANIDAERIVAKAKELFPEYFSLQELKLKLGKLQWERAKLADAKVRTTRLISLSWLTPFFETVSWNQCIRPQGC